MFVSWLIHGMRIFHDPADLDETSSISSGLMESIDMAGVVGRSFIVTATPPLENGSVGGSGKCCG